MSRLAKPALFCDVDGTLAFQPEGDILAVNARYGTSWLVADAVKYPFRSMLPDDQAAWLAASFPVIAANLAPDTRAIRVLAKAAKAGLTVTVCTERDPALTALTRAWLIYWQVPHTALAVVGPGGKKDLLASHGEDDPALLVDDSPVNEGLARPGVEVWAPLRPWTPQDGPPAGVTRFGDWRDVRKRLGLKK